MISFSKRYRYLEIRGPTGQYRYKVVPIGDDHWLLIIICNNEDDSFQIASKARLAMSDKMSTEQFCLRWNDFHSNITSAFSDIRDDDEFLDVTLVSNILFMSAVDGRILDSINFMIFRCFKLWIWQSYHLIWVSLSLLL